MNKYVKLDSYCKHMTADELKEYFPKGEYTMAYLMRSLIMNEKEYCNSLENRTLRGVWYSAIKPTLDKLGLLDKNVSESTMVSWDKKLSIFTCDLVRSGDLRFSDLGIKDVSRKKETPRDLYYSVYSRKKAYTYKSNVAPYPNILIATEKDTVYENIQTIAEFYGCSCISCKGQNSLGAMEQIVQGMLRSEENFDKIIILTMTDYDPAGYYIADALEKQVNDILKSLGQNYYSVETHRVGIMPDQLSKEDVYQNMYTPKPANMEKWMDITNGIDGEPKGLELDAFSNKQIREIFVSNLSEFVDIDLYKAFIKESYIKIKVLESIEDKVLEIYEKAKDKFLEKITVKDFDIHAIAIDGDSSISIREVCETNNDEKISKYCNKHLKVD